MTELLERGALLGALDDALAATTQAGSVVLLSGEAGVGKSSLVARFTERHRSDARVVVGTCDPLLTPRALGPLLDVGRELGGHVADVLAHGGPREDLLSALVDELGGPGRPRVVVIEDAHWAGEATLDLLVLLGRRIRPLPAVLLVTYRDDEVGIDHPLRWAVSALPQDALRRLHVEPLSPDGVAELARRAGRPASGLHTLTGGNPLLVTEVLAADDGGVPLTVRDLALARFARLAPSVQEAVRLVAVVPTRVEHWLLEATSGADTMSVDEGVASGLLVAGREGVAFRHELLRQAVEGSLSPLTRRRLNRRVLAALEATPREVDPARLVHHAREADDVDAILRHAPEAARRSVAVAAHREAVRHYRAALEHADRLAPAVHVELLEELSIECYVAGLAADAVAARGEAVRLRAEAGEPEQVGAGLRWLSRLHWWDGNRTEAEAAGARAVEVLEPLGPGHELAMAYSNQSQLALLAHRHVEATAWADRAIALARRLDDRRALSHALTNRGSSSLYLGRPEGRDELEQGFDVALVAGLEDDAARALVNLGSINAELRDHAHAVPDLERGIAFVRAHELVGYAQHLLGHRARVRLDRGDWAGAEADAWTALAEVVTGGARVVDALVPLGLVQARRGDPQAAATFAEAAARGNATVELQWTAPVAAARAEWEWLNGHDARVPGEVEDALARATEVRHPWFVAELLLWVGLAGGRPAVPEWLPEPYRALLAGEWRSASAAWEERGLPYHRALALACGNDDARLAALEVLDALGARQTALRVRRDLRRRGHRSMPRGPIRATAGNPAGLTARQVDVLHLVAEGLTDAEIASRLSLSTKTVGHHVSALLAKLGVASRRETAAAARRIGVVPDPGSTRP